MLSNSYFAKQSGYYPYSKGRASLEDLYHSVFLRSKGCKLFIDRSAFLVVDKFDSGINISSRSLYFKNTWASVGKQLHFNSVYSYSSLRYLIYLIFIALRVFGDWVVNLFGFSSSKD